MKTIFSIFSIISVCYSTAFAQPPKSVIIVDVKIPGGSPSYLLELTHEKPYGKLDKRIVKNNSSTTFINSDSAPFWATVDLKNQKDSSISNASLFLVTSDTIRIVFDTEEPPASVSGGENVFFDKNRYLLFDLPGGMFVSAYRTDVRKSYQYQTFSGYLYPRVIEYLAKCREILEQYGNYYFVLEQLTEKKENFPLDFLEKSLSLIDSSLHSTKPWNDLVLYINQEKHLHIGKTIPTFDIQSPNLTIEKMETLYRRQPYTFIDFWASWCVPCREDMKTLKAIYSDVDTTLIKIISVSIDENRLEWIDANKKEQLPWETYIDFSGKVAKGLNISYIPQGFIVDEKGKIVDRFVRMEGFKEFAGKINAIKK